MHAMYSELVRFFTERRPSDPVIVLIIDEIDQLVTRNQAVLYKIFDWLLYPKARLVVAAISNTMDLPERLLPRVTSRFGTTAGIHRVDFHPYNREQLQHIMTEMLTAHDALEAFDAEALQVCAARVAAGSGDIRKALQVCRRALELRLLEAKETGNVGSSHLVAAFAELLRDNPAARELSALGPKAQRLMACVYLELRKRGIDAVPEGNVVQRYLALAQQAPLAACPESSAEDVYESSTNEVLALIKRLTATTLLRTFRNPAGAGRMVELGCSVDLEDLVGVLTRDSKDDTLVSDMVLHVSRGR
eukprot:SRR837773.11423.p1 GENE.SRR837773.11423~~SRR837773.11423.p1  ORF type:complete len:304 (-),score=135.21 SRR837773.11423:215-1126(-)